MSTTFRFQGFLKYDVMDYLLHRAPVYIRYLTHRDILDEEPRKLEELFAKVEHKHGDILRKQQDDGYWPVRINSRSPQRKEVFMFLTQLQHLYFLLDHGFTRDHPVVQKGIVALMKLQKQDGRFPIAYQHHGLTLYVLVSFNLKGNPFLEKGYRWIVKRQRKDGGWIHPTVLDDNVKETDSLKSCIWTTLHIAMALTRHSRYRKLECTRRAINFLLENYLQANHKNFFGDASSWNHLYYGYEGNSIFRGGTLKYLETLVEFGLKRDEKIIRKITDWLRDQQLSNALFPAIPKMDKKGDPFVTFRVARVLYKLFA